MSFTRPVSGKDYMEFFLEERADQTGTKVQK